MVRTRLVDADVARLAGTVLTALATARLVWFDMLIHNPAWADQWVGALPVLNLILPEYLLSAVWLYLARRRADAGDALGLLARRLLRRPRRRRRCCSSARVSTARS